jgi:hypothetical protein
LGRITTVVTSRSGQLGRCYTIEPNCSGLSAHFADASVTRERTLETCESSYVLETARLFFISVVHSPLGGVGYVAAPELSSWGGRAQSHETRGSIRAHLSREARSGAEEHVAGVRSYTVRDRRAPCLDLKFMCGGTRSTGY